jgi:hypothetical protein
MSKSKDITPSTDATDAEIELTAQELRALSNSRLIDESEAHAVKRPSDARTSAPSSKVTAAGIATNGRVIASRVLLAVLVSVSGAAYVLNTSSPTTLATVNTSQQPISAEQPSAEQIAKGEVVRFANPFDSDEVFEFPPGTTTDEAREAVAAVLMERAISRQKS